MSFNTHDDVYDGLVHMMNASNLDELRQIFERLMCSFGFDLFALQFTPTDSKVIDVKPVIIANYDKKWVDYYHSQAYHQIDPVITVGSKKQKPFLWSDTWQEISLTKRQRDFFYEAKEHGVSSGIGMPVLSPSQKNGMITLVSSHLKPGELGMTIKTEAPQILLLSMHFQQLAQHLIDRDQINVHSIVLTGREKECLRWAAAGKTNREIASILDISFRTVEHHFENCYRKLNAVSREQAVAKAIITKAIIL